MSSLHDLRFQSIFKRFDALSFARMRVLSYWHQSTPACFSWKLVCTKTILPRKCLVVTELFVKPVCITHKSYNLCLTEPTEGHYEGVGWSATCGILIHCPKGIYVSIHLIGVLRLTQEYFTSWKASPQGLPVEKSFEQCVLNKYYVSRESLDVTWMNEWMNEAWI